MAETVTSTLPIRRDTVRAFNAGAAPVEAAPLPSPVRAGGLTPLPFSLPAETASLLERTSRATEERPRPLPLPRETRETFIMTFQAPQPAGLPVDASLWSAPLASAPHSAPVRRPRWRPRSMHIAALLPLVCATGTGGALRVGGQEWQAAAAGAAASLLMTACTFAAGAIAARRDARPEPRTVAPACTDTTPAPPSPPRALRTRRPSPPASRPVARWTEEHGEPDPAIRARALGAPAGTLEVVEAAPIGLMLAPAADGSGWRWQWGPGEGAVLHSLPLASGGVYTIGTGEGCDVHLPATDGASISHQHARITVRRGRVLFHHIGEEGESHINGERAVWAVLEPGDTIGIGPYRCRLLAPSST